MNSTDQFDYQKLDELLHVRIRTAIVAILQSVEKADFNYLKKRTSATDGNLSTHLRKLEEAGYVQVEKKFVGRKPVTNYWLTEQGHQAFINYLANLEEMLRQ